MGKDEKNMIQETELENHIALTSKRLQKAEISDSDGPVIVLFVGMHGNETAGVQAVENMFRELSSQLCELNGSLYAVTGNLEALKRGVRYIDTDLNRLWEMYNTEKDFSSLSNNAKPAPVEYRESLEIKTAIDEILEKHSGRNQKIIFADIHTTSSESCAFILLNDTLQNREIARKFPVPQILGIEENIHGTLLSYINNLGYRAIGFEAGAHTSSKSVQRSEAFIRLLMHNTGVRTLDAAGFEKSEEQIQAYDEVPGTYYDIRYHHLIEDAELFNMNPGFKNFDLVEKDMPLAYENGTLIKAPVSGRIFMPLYQKRGNDGFLIVEEVSPFWLTFSAWLRTSSIHSFMKLLPGVKKIDDQIFEVNREVALFFVKEMFHLLGYRVTEKNSTTYLCYRR